MFFYLTNNLIFAPDSAEERLYADFARNLAFVVDKSMHLLGGDYDVLAFYASYFKDKDNFSQRIFGYYKDNYTSEGMVPNFVKYYIKVEKIGVAIQRIVTNQYICYIVPIDYFSNATLGKCRLVCEYLYDDKFFSYVCNWYKTKHKINLQTSFAYENGGGGTTSEVLCQRIVEKEVALGVTDTDKRFPADIPKNDSTYFKCMNIKPRIDSCPLVDFISLDVHEIENILPGNWINSIATRHFQIINRTIYNKLLTHDENALPEEIRVLKYFDLKKGLKEKDGEPEEYKEFVKLCYLITNQDKTEEDFHNEYTDGKEMVKGAYGHLLDESLALIDNGTCPEPMLLDFQLIEWERLGACLLSMGCARNKEVLN